jgi:hypothetical protein
MARSKRRNDRSIPAHPYRDTVLVYGVLALVLVGLAALTGGAVVRASLVALTFFLAATAWSWWKFRGRIREREVAGAAAAAGATREGGDSGLANGNGSGSGGEPQ